MTLKLHSDASGLCHYLDGKPVRVGDLLEVFVNGKWVQVKYGWSRLAKSDAYGTPANSDETSVALRPTTPVRWPQCQEGESHERPRSTGRKIRSFQAFGTSGETYSIDIYADVEESALNHPDEAVVGDCLLKLTSGEIVNRIRKGQYEICATGEKLTSTDPRAI